MYRMAEGLSPGREEEVMEDLGRWAGRARNTELVSSFALALAAASLVFVIYPPQGVFVALFAIVGLVGGYALHLAVGRPVVTLVVAQHVRAVARRESLDADRLRGVAVAFVE